MEYSTDQLARDAWITDASGLELDYMEYASDGAAQAAYVSSETLGGEEILISQETENGQTLVGDYDNDNYWNGQSFTLTSTVKITAVSQDYGVRTGAPTGNNWYRIETEVDGKPSGILAHANAISDTFEPVDNAWNKASFTEFELAPGTYWLVCLCDDQATNQRWTVHYNTGGSVYPGGVWGYALNGTWDTNTLFDATFRIYGKSIVLQCYSESSIKNQGNYSLKVVAKQTDSLNDTLTKSGLSLNLTDKDTLKLDVRASRTGTNLQARLYDSVGGWITKDINITSADIFQTTTWDISGISNANKSNITKIEFKILNADSETTYYIDNFRIPEALQCYSEDTIKVQGDYSLKVLAAQTGSLNKTLTKTLTDYLDYSIMDVIKLDVRASRTGSNIKLKIHDTGGVTSEHTINIASADTWQTEVWDISAITGTNRDTIDKIIIEISNADAGNTAYFDNLYSKAVVETSHVFIG